MVRDIVRDIIFLGIKSEQALPSDLAIADDLLDTLKAHSEECVGMAANMIGYKKRIIAFADEECYSVMFNPEIIKKNQPFETGEGCLSLDGTRPVKRFKNIKIRYFNREFKVRIKNYSGWTAQIIQHEIDHCNGVII